jgi:chromate transporter
MSDIGSKAAASGIDVPARPTIGEAFRFWLKLGFISFGGPAGQIAIMHEEIVERRKWISEDQFLHALNYCMLLPGPEAQQLATYIGWLLHRTWGGIVAGSLFVLPSAVILWALSWMYVVHGEVKWVAAMFDGLKPAVLAIVLGAVYRIGGKALKNEVMWCVAVLAFVGIFFLKLPFPFIIIAAGVTGLIGGKYWREKFIIINGHGKSKTTNAAPVPECSLEGSQWPTLARALKVCVIGLTLWWLPILGVGAWLGADHTVTQQGLFFSKAAMVTFGGAYAVLPYVSQQAVENYGWLSAGQMLDGLGLAETTPGPLIMVLQFVGFLGGWNHAAPLSPLITATLAAFITTWATFLPCFIWIFLGAPYVEHLRGNERLSAALSTITAAVVGVILNLGVWFGWHVLWPKEGPVNWLGIVICLVAIIGMTRWKWGIIPIIAGAAVMGVIYHAMVV